MVLVCQSSTPAALVRKDSMSERVRRVDDLDVLLGRLVSVRRFCLLLALIVSSTLIARTFIPTVDAAPDSMEHQPTAVIVVTNDDENRIYVARLDSEPHYSVECPGAFYLRATLTAIAAYPPEALAGFATAMEEIGINPTYQLAGTDDTKNGIPAPRLIPNGIEYTWALDVEQPGERSGRIFFPRDPGDGESGRIVITPRFSFDFEARSEWRRSIIWQSLATLLGSWLTVVVTLLVPLVIYSLENRALRNMPPPSAPTPTPVLPSSSSAGPFDSQPEVESE